MTERENTPTKEEVTWALAVKRAVEEDPTLSKNSSAISDFELLQHSIVAKGNTEKALRRIKRLFRFKEKYGILGDGSYEQGLRDVVAFENTLPDFTLGCAMAKDGTQVLSFDFSRYKVRRLESNEACAICMRAFFYSLQCCSANLEMIRNGVRLLGDFGGLSWDNFSVTAEKRAAELYSDCYPMRMKEMIMMDANPLIRIFYGVLKLFLSKKVAQTFKFPKNRDQHLKHESNCGLDAIPTCWGGNHSREELGKLFPERLKQRYVNVERFRLPKKQ